MSNYLKKLAYVHDAMQKLAASNDYPGVFVEWPFGYNIHATPADTFRKTRVSTNTETMPSKPSAKVKPGVTKPVASTSATGTTNTLTDEQMRQNIENYQNEYRDQYARINGYTPEEAERRIRAKGNWYDTSDMNALRTLMQSASDRRLRRIATGRKTMANKTWSVPVNGQKAKIKMNFSDAMDAMQQKRTQREQARIADEKLRQPRSGLYNSITNPYGMGAGQSTPPATTTFSPDTGELNVSTDIDLSKFNPNKHGINGSISPSLVQRPILPAKRQFSVTPYTDEQKKLLDKKREADSKGKGYYMNPTSGDVYAETPVDVNAPDYRDYLDSGDPNSYI